MFIRLNSTSFGLVLANQGPCGTMGYGVIVLAIDVIPQHQNSLLKIILQALCDL